MTRAFHFRDRHILSVCIRITVRCSHGATGQIIRYTEVLALVHKRAIRTVSGFRGQKCEEKKLNHWAWLHWGRGDRCKFIK